MSADRALAIVVEYEAAAIAALRARDGIDRRQQFLARLRWADAAEALNTLNDTDRSSVGELLLQRGNVPHHAWPRILPALKAERHARGRVAQGTAVSRLSPHRGGDVGAARRVGVPDRGAGRVKNHAHPADHRDLCAARRAHGDGRDPRLGGERKRVTPQGMGLSWEKHGNLPMRPPLSG